MSQEGNTREGRGASYCAATACSSRGTLATETTRKGHVLGLNGDTLCVDGGKVGVLEKRDEVGFCSLLKRHDRRRLETQVRLEVLRNLTHKTLERQLANQKLYKTSRVSLNTRLNPTTKDAPVLFW